MFIINYFSNHKIYKYLTFYFIKAILGFCLVVSFIILLVDFSENFRKYSDDSSVTIYNVMLITILKLPNLLLEISPFIVLFASLYCIRNLVLKREMDIFKACGLSIWKVLVPFLVVALLYGLVLIFLISPVSTFFLQTLDKLENGIKNKQEVIQVSDSNVWIILQGVNNQEYILLSKGVSKNKKNVANLSDISMFEIQNSQVIKMVNAQSGTLDKKVLTFFNVIEKNQGENFPNKKERLIINVQQNSSGVTNLSLEPTNVFLWQFPKVIDDLRQVNLSYNQHIVYFYNLISQPLLLLAMVLISARFSLGDVRKGKNIYVIFSVIIVGIFLYFLSTFLGALGNSGLLNPIIIIVASKIIILLFAINLLFIKEKL